MRKRTTGCLPTPESVRLNGPRRGRPHRHCPGGSALDRSQASVFASASRPGVAARVRLAAALLILGLMVWTFRRASHNRSLNCAAARLGSSSMHSPMPTRHARFHALTAPWQILGSIAVVAAQSEVGLALAARQGRELLQVVEDQALLAPAVAAYGRAEPSD